MIPLQGSTARETGDRLFPRGEPKPDFAPRAWTGLAPPYSVKVNHSYLYDFVQQSVEILHNASRVRTYAKRHNKLYREMWAGADPGQDQLWFSFAIENLPFFQSENIRDCSAMFHTPLLTKFCPLGLVDIAQLANYYRQAVYDEAIENGWGLPHVLTTNAMDVDGTVRTGVQPMLIYDADKYPAPADGAHNTTRYAYSASILTVTVRTACAETAKGHSLCPVLLKQLSTMRAQYPRQMWTDAVYGRLLAVPP